MKKTRIIATIGPSSDDTETLSSLCKRGMNCTRINTAHSDFEWYEETVERIRECSTKPIMMDVKGPELRIKTDQPLTFSEGETKVFNFSEGAYPHFSYDFFDEVEEGDDIYFDNGLYHGIIQEKNKVDGRKIDVKFLGHGEIKPNKGVNIPGRNLDIPNLSEKDKKVIEWSKQRDIAYIALSFVRSKQDVQEVKRRLDDEQTGVISKIENKQGVDNIKEILEVSDGVMVARGDLGVELPEEKIPLIQKRIVREANEQGKISIVATEMLESMKDKPVPTRAEISDVANAVLDGADAVMLSGETAIGNYPLDAVSTMRKACLELENHISRDVQSDANGGVSEEMSKSAYYLSIREKTDRVVTHTRSGYSAKLMSRFRMKKPVIALTPNEMTYKQLQLVWGVKPVSIDDTPEVNLVTNLTEILLEKEEIRRDDYVVYFAGVKTLEEKISNVIEVHKVEDLLRYQEMHS